MRLKLKHWFEDESGLVLAFSALTLPVILLLGVMVLQNGQLYVREAQLQFLVRQAANSSLISLAQILQNQAEANYRSTCNVEFPPSVCSSDDWTDFLSPMQARFTAAQSSTVSLVRNEVQNFALNQDPRAQLQVEFLTIDFPLASAPADQLIVEAQITEPQTDWLGNILRSDDFSIQVRARSYLNLTS